MLWKKSCLIINWLFSRAPPVFAQSVKFGKQSSDQMGCVFVSKMLMSRWPHCAPSKAAWWAHQKYQGDIPFTHTWEKNPRLCTQLPVPAKVLYKYCVQQSKLHRLRENHRNIQETQSLFPFWGASCTVMICKADGMLPLWCPGVSWHLQAQPETPGEAANGPLA